MKEKHVQVYAIGIEDYSQRLRAGNTGRVMIEELANISGGRAFFSNSVQELDDICTKIALELKNRTYIDPIGASFNRHTR